MGEKSPHKECLSPTYIAIQLLSAAAEENENDSDDDPPNVVITEKIAQAVIHKNPPKNL